ncbi:MAG: cytidylyltransferase domain-containing protein [Elusimicrobiota bacterium]
MINDKKILSVITARAGSRGVPGKNFKHINGTPLIVWSVNQSLSSQYIDFTVVSSNSEKIRQCTEYAYTNKKYMFIDRPHELATDISPNEDTLIHAYKYVKKECKFDADLIINLQPTSPIRNNGLIDKCIEYIGDHDSLLTVKKIAPFFLYKNKDKFYQFDKSKLMHRPMRQQLHDDDFFYYDCGNLYIVSSKVLLNQHSRLGENFAVFVVDDKQGLQIDTKIDFEILDMVMARIKNNF